MHSYESSFFKLEDVATFQFSNNLFKNSNTSDSNLVEIEGNTQNVFYKIC